MNKDEDIMEKFYEAVNKTGFKFWTCPNGCRDFVDWSGETAKCRKCGADNKRIHKDAKKDAHL